MLPPIHRSVFFYWNSLVEPRLPFYMPFQIRVKSYSKTIYQCIVYEGASIRILSSSTWKAIGSPQLVSAPSQLLYFDRRPSESFGILPQFPIMFGGNIVMVNMIAVNVPLDFNMFFSVIMCMLWMFWCLRFFEWCLFLTTYTLSSSINFHMIITILIWNYTLLPHFMFLVFRWTLPHHRWIMWHHILTVQFLLKMSLYDHVFLLGTCSHKLIHKSSRHQLTLIKNSILIWNMISTLWLHGLLTLLVLAIS